MNVILFNRIKAGVFIAGVAITCCTVTCFAQDFTQPDFRIVVDNEFQGMNYAERDGLCYVPARQLCESFGAEVIWNGPGMITIRHDSVNFKPAFYIQDSRAMISEESIKNIFGFETAKIAEANILTISITGKETNMSVIESNLPTFNGYNAEDLEWLAKIIHAEANGEPYEAKIAVGSVIMNRMASGMYPNTVKGVIFDRKSGVQFTPTSNGSVYNSPSLDSRMAALEVLEGKRNANGALFFLNPRYAKSSWVSRNREFAFTMENHDFYY